MTMIYKLWPMPRVPFPREPKLSWTFSNSFCPRQGHTLIFQYYNTARDESPLDEETIEQMLPRISGVSGLDQMIDLRDILVWYDNDDWSSSIGILAECSWEEEPCPGVKIADSKAAALTMH